LFYVLTQHLLLWEHLQAESPIDNFLKSLGLEKYSVNFQAEEVWLFPKSVEYSFSPLILLTIVLQVDMAALRHMTESDLKALGIPMVSALHHVRS
jgi:hypothetical protein